MGSRFAATVQRSTKLRLSVFVPPRLFDNPARTWQFWCWQVSEATGMGVSKPKAAGEEAQQQTGSASTNRGAGSNGTGIVQQVRFWLGIV